MIVKVCGLTNAADAAFAAAEGADYLGFVVHPPSLRHCVDPAEASRDVRDRAVLVVVADDADLIMRMASGFGIQNLQPHVHPEYQIQVLQRLKNEGYFILLPWFDGRDHPAIQADLYIWESDPKETGVAGGSGRTHALDEPPPGPFLLAGGLDAENLREQASHCSQRALARLRGFDAASRLELSPGIKDPAKVRAFIQTAKSMTSEVHHARD